MRQSDKFEWYLKNKDSDDWRSKLFYQENWIVGTRIIAVNGDIWADDEYKKWEQGKKEKEEAERKHEEELKKIRQERLVAEEEERIRVKRANECFLAKHQKNTPTQRYINKFCNENSDIDITDESIINEALHPDLNEVSFEDVQKHNCKLYKDYLKTPLWRIISSKIKWNADFECEKCHSKNHLQVHHKSYEFKGVEFLSIEDLECLCSECHKAEHSKCDKDSR